MGITFLLSLVGVFLAVSNYISVPGIVTTV